VDRKVGGDHLKGAAEVVLRHCPVERHALARAFLERVAVDVDRLLQPRRPVLALPERLKGVAEVVLRRRPLKRYALSRRSSIAADISPC
jgi:hypothetical protein